MIPVGRWVGPAMGLPPNFREMISAAHNVTYWAKDDKARRELGYEPRDLDTGLRQTIGEQRLRPSCLGSLYGTPPRTAGGIRQLEALDRRQHARAAERLREAGPGEDDDADLGSPSHDACPTA